MANTDQKDKIKAVLVQLYGQNTNKKYNLTGPEVQIGRSMKSQIKLQCPNVSRKHCVLTYYNNKWKIRDNNSQNGTYINGRKLGVNENYFLRCGDIVFLGPPTEMPETFSFDDVIDEEAKESDENTVMELPMKRVAEDDVISSKKVKDEKASKSSYIKDCDRTLQSTNSGDSSRLSNKSQHCNLADNKYERILEHVLSTVVENKNTSDEFVEQCSRISSTVHNPISFGNSESLLDVVYDDFIDPFHQTESYESMQIGTTQSGTTMGHNIMNSVECLENEMLKSKLASMSEALEKLEKTKLELLKDYDDICEKNKLLGQQLAAQKKLQKDIKMCEVKAKNEIKSQLLETFEEDLICHICTELLIQPTVLDCSHTFCEYCIKEWKKKKNECPMCRCKIEHLTRVRTLEEFINKILGTLTPDQIDKRDQLMRERIQVELQAKKAHTPTSRRRSTRHRRFARNRAPNNTSVQAIEQRTLLPLDLTPGEGPLYFFDMLPQLSDSGVAAMEPLFHTGPFPDYGEATMEAFSIDNPMLLL